MSDTIYALSSAPGKAGVAVMRVSGPKAHALLSDLTPGASLPAFRQAVLREIKNPVSRETIDQALVFIFKGPHSFTGEDMAEFHLHGSQAVISALIEVFSKIEGLRMAAPGEFTRRAFENGKMDLTEAEAIADLIDAETQAQRIQALSQMEGALSDLYNGWADELKKILAHIEAVIDFPDEDVPDEEILKMRPAVEKLIGDISIHLQDNHRGERLRNGIQVVIVGEPNAGKSSLINALAQRDVAIVSEMAGTTRDIIEVHLDLGGYPIILHDTAGLRPGLINESNQERIESEGIRRALKKAQEADLKILMFDGTQDQLSQNTLNLIDNTSILVINKKDQIGETFHVKQAEGHPVWFISAHTREGVSDFLNYLIEKTKEIINVSRETPSLTRQRHRQALTECLVSLNQACENDIPELMAEELRIAIRALGRIKGRVDIEDLLDVIFKDFCIGK